MVHIIATAPALGREEYKWVGGRGLLASSPRNMKPDDFDFGGSFLPKCLCVGFGRGDAATEPQRAGAHLDEAIPTWAASRFFSQPLGTHILAES